MKNLKLNLLFWFCTLFCVNQLQAQGCKPEFESYKFGKLVTFYSPNFIDPVSNFYLWNFGTDTNWTYQTDYSIEFTYPSAGKYRVCLIDSFCTGPVKMTCDSITVYNQTPVVADFSYTLDQGIGKITVEENASSTSPMASFQWDFGDNYAGEGSVYEHYYTESGTYNVCLIALDRDYNYNYQCSSVVVFVNAPCVADFEYSFAQDSYKFLNTSVDVGDSSSWFWDFGDSTYSTDKNATHQYQAPGSYTVTLRMTGYCTKEVSKTIYYPGPGLCDLKLSSTLDNQKLTLTITDSSFIPNFYFVDFGDGDFTHAGETTIYHTYKDTGTYYIYVQTHHPICGTIGGYDTVRVTSLTPICQSVFYLLSGDTATNSMSLYSLSDIQANNGYSKYTLIYWGDDTFEADSTGKYIFTHDYANPGIYQVKLVMTNNATCWDTTAYLGGVGPLVTAKGKVTGGGNAFPYVLVKAFAYEPASGTLDILNAAFTNDSGEYEMHLYKGMYLLQSDFAFDPTLSEFFLPTYYGNKLNWTAGDVVTMNGNRDNLDIELIPFNPSTQLTGKISGNAIFGEGVIVNNQTMNPGTPVDKMLIFLLNQEGKVVSYTHSKPDGQFEFTNVGTGTFTVWAEMAGKVTIPPVVYLSGNNTEANQVRIVIGKNSVTSLNDRTKSAEPDGINLYPNPAKDFITWVAETNIEPELIQIIDMQGRTYTPEYQIAENGCKVNVQGLSEGIYVMEVRLQNGQSFRRKFTIQP